MLESISARLSGQVCRSAILGRYAAAHAWKDSLGIDSFGRYGLADNKSSPFLLARKKMIAPRISMLTITMIIVGYVIGLVSPVSESSLSSFTPLSTLVAANISLACAAGLNLAILMSAISAVIYSVFSKDEAVEVFEWYGCLIFGGRRLRLSRFVANTNRHAPLKIIPAVIYVYST